MDASNPIAEFTDREYYVCQFGDRLFILNRDNII